jgi:hypothetical protein
MPNFTDSKTGGELWLPADRIIRMEGGPGGLVTIVHALLVSDKGPVIGIFEAVGRCSTLGAAIDSGKPTEVGQ